MSISKVKLTLILIVCLVVLLFVLWPLRSPYFRFMHNRHNYYALLARACDALLIQHPLGTNSVIEVPISDPSVPAIISDLHPTMIQVSSNRVWVMVGIREFAVSWEQQDSNHWAMIDIGEGVEQKVYVESRP